MEDESKKPKINNISFTCDNFMFSFGTEEGFYIYNVKPFELLSHRKLEGGILFTEILDHSNLIIFVGDGTSQKYPNNKVFFWDDSNQKCISEIHHFALSISKNNTTDQIVCIDELKLSLLAKSCLCRGIIALISNLIITNNFEEGIEKQLGNSKWIDEYKHGKDYEIYKIPLEYLRGYKFSVCAEKIYNEKKMILFGLNIESKSDSSNIVLLSPMEFIVPIKRDVNVFGYLLAKDQNDADEVTAWEKTQKRIEVTKLNYGEININKRRMNKHNMELEEGEIQIETNIKGGDIYSTDALSLAKICHIYN